MVRTRMIQMNLLVVIIMKYGGRLPWPQGIHIYTRVVNHAIVVVVEDHHDKGTYIKENLVIHVDNEHHVDRDGYYIYKCCKQATLHISTLEVAD